MNEPVRTVTARAVPSTTETSFALLYHVWRHRVLRTIPLWTDGRDADFPHR